MIQSLLEPASNVDSSKIAFILCSPRSGSTMLTRILDSHSQIASPCEIAFPIYFKGDKKHKQVLKKYKLICDYYEAGYLSSRFNYKYLIDKILQKEKKQYLVIKDPRSSLFFSDIIKRFPQAKFIHLIRDVRSVAMSPKFQKDTSHAFDLWFEYNNTVESIVKSNSSIQSLKVKYEDIVNHPNDSIKSVTDFLGYEFEPPMIDYGNFEHADEKMKLWSNKSSKQSAYHKDLGNTVRKEVLADRENYNEQVLTCYEDLAKIRAMNIEFGYVE